MCVGGRERRKWNEAGEAPATDGQALEASLRNLAFVLRARGSHSRVLWRGMVGEGVRGM